MAFIGNEPKTLGKFSLDDGTAAEPSLFNTGDLNTGVYFPADDTIAISTGGNEIARVTGAGITLTSSPAATAAAKEIVTAAWVRALLGAAWVEEGVLTAPDAAASDYFGISVALSSDGTVLAVGANWWEGAATDQGGVYIYDRNGSGWTQRGSVLTASDAAAGDRFGVSVALSADGTVLAVGAFLWEGAANNQGGVYIYDRNGSDWTQRGSVLTASDAAASDYFGRAVALSSDGTVLAVGAHSWEGAADNQGGVYIYDIDGSGWTQRGSVLTAPDAAAGDYFGNSVALSSDGTVLAVGALVWEGAATDQGGVYIYDRNGSGWTQRGSVLTASDAAAIDNFGHSVALSSDGTVLAVGAYGWEGAANNQGGVYIYDIDGSGWTQRGSVLTASDAAEGDQFGSSVALSSDGTVLAVGAYSWEGAAADQGCVYAFKALRGL